ncbi:MAG: ferredoxin-NADP reductase [Gammaproteobacteria bacterium]|jgi:ferredoxin-NADP reductase
MTTNFSIPVTVINVEQLTPIIKGFTFERNDSEPFTPFSAGSHIVVSMDDEQRSYKNPYSLVRNSPDFKQYQIAVRREANGRGGSAYMHDEVEVGSQLEVGNPFNLFPVHWLAHKHLFIAGGVGITPFMAFIRDMKMTNSPFELHYAVRNAKHGPFVAELVENNLKEVFIYDRGEDQVLDFKQLLSKQPLGTHVYVCGPHRMVEDVLRIAESRGWPQSAIHSEEFKAPDAGQPFSVKLARSQRDVHVSERESLLEALERTGVEVPYSCRGGACGFCKTDVVSGEPEHRDYYLSDEEKAANNCIMPCISRAINDDLVLDL